MSETELQDAILRHSLQILRLSAGEQAVVEQILKELARELKALLDSKTLSSASRKPRPEIDAEAKKMISGSYGAAAASTDTKGIAITVAEKTVAAMGLILPVSAVMPTAETLASLSTDVLIEGAKSSLWWKEQADGLSFKFAAQLQQGIVNGETNERIIQRIVGKRGEPGIMDVSRREARALVHTSVQTAANHSRLATYRKNSRLIKGVRQLSTFDGRTSDICIAYSDGEWDLDGNPLKGTTLPFNGGPPRHWNCRSILTPITKTFREIGLDIDEPSPGERASSLGPIAGDTSVAAFLKRQPKGFADDVLGKGRDALWRDGTITLRDLISGTGRTLTLEELRKLN